MKPLPETLCVSGFLWWYKVRHSFWLLFFSTQLFSHGTNERYDWQWSGMLSLKHQNFPLPLSLERENNKTKRTLARTLMRRTKSLKCRLRKSWVVKWTVQVRENKKELPGECVLQHNLKGQQNIMSGSSLMKFLKLVGQRSQKTCLGTT